MTERPKDTEADRVVVKWTGKQCHALLPPPHPEFPDCCDAPGWCWILWGEAMSGRYKFSEDEKDADTSKEKSGTTPQEEPSVRPKLWEKAYFRGVMPLLAMLALSYFAIFAFVGLVWFLMGWWP